VTAKLLREANQSKSSEVKPLSNSSSTIVLSWWMAREIQARGFICPIKLKDTRELPATSCAESKH